MKAIPALTDAAGGRSRLIPAEGHLRSKLSVQVCRPSEAGIGDDPALNTLMYKQLAKNPQHFLKIVNIFDWLTGLGAIIYSGLSMNLG